METTMNLQELLHTAMKEHDHLKKRVLRMLMTTVKLAEVSKGSKLDPQETLAVFQKEIKSRHEALLDAEKANRPDLIADAKAEIEYLQTFLPKQLSEDKLEKIAQEIITELGASGPKDMGRVMKLLLPKLEGKASSQRASQTVKTLLEKLG
ncbi:MAG: GatB/YqeY domain-containing protein [Anaerolineaceae bacterium]|nr:GatB/YqeY domain-containing protein [Anaerolineaceae bacterium]